MLPIRYLLTLWILGQNSPPSTPPKPAEGSKPPAATASQPSGSSKAGAETPAKAATPPAKPAEEPDTEVDKFVRGEADRLDKIVDVSADFVQTIRYQDQEIQTTGVYKAGAKRKLRLEINHTHGGVSGRLMFICNGAVGYQVLHYGTTTHVLMFRIDELAPLIEGKDMSLDERNALAFRLQLPFVYPSQMLRGYLARLTFTKKEDAKLGGRDVVKLEGRWRRNTVAMMMGKPDASVDDIGGDFPQYVAVQLDKQTGWPLQLEQFRREKDVGVFKPAFSMRFSKIAVGTPVPEADFTYVPPQGLEVRDRTAEIKDQLTNYREQKAAAAKAQPAAGQKTPTPVQSSPGAGAPSK